MDYIGDSYSSVTESKKGEAQFHGNTKKQDPTGWDSPPQILVSSL